MLLNHLERVLCDAVCDMGVDLNLAVAHDHYAPLLAFVGGLGIAIFIFRHLLTDVLGLRKADALRRDIRRKLPSVTSRKEILERKILGKVVFNNCIGFLRVRDDNDEVELDPLDDTRIHPECYNVHNFAIKICCDALEVPLSHDHLNVRKIMADSKKHLRLKLDDQVWLNEWEVLIKSGGGERKMEELSDMLSELELEPYVLDLEMKGYGKRAKQVEQIKEELRFPWLDLREPLSPPAPYDVFRLVTKSDDYVLYVGLQVSCQVVEIKEKSAALSIEGVYRGFASIRNIADRRIDSIYEILKVGQKKTGVVIGVDKEKLTLDISFKDEHLDRYALCICSIDPDEKI